MSRILKHTLYLLAVIVTMYSCVSIKKQIDASGAHSNLSQVAKKRIPTNHNEATNANGSNITVVKKDSVSTYITDVEIDEEGRQISKINIEEIIVTSTMKSIPERFGFVSIDFVVTIPKELQNEQWCIKLTPVLNQKDTIIRLDPVVIRGEALDMLQKRQYWQQSKYQKTVEQTAQKLNDTTKVEAERYKKRQEFFIDKGKSYNLTIYNKRLDFFDIRNRTTMNLYSRRVDHFSNSSADTEKYLAFFGRQPSESVMARMENARTKLEEQALNNMQIRDRYGITHSTMDRRETRLVNVKRRHDDMVSYPMYSEARMDSLITDPQTVTYFYSQDIKTTEHTSHMTLALQGDVEDFRGRKKELAPSDTLTFTVASMVSFIDHTPRYVYKIVEKYATVNDRNMISFPIGKSRLIDTLADNKIEIEKMTKLMNTLLYQYEFYVDSVILTAASSPEGNKIRNNTLSRDRAHALQEYLIGKFNKDIDTILKVRWIGEDWSRLASMIATDSRLANRSEILDIISKTDNVDRRDQLIRSKYPADFKVIKDEFYPQLRSVSFKYSLRRVGMVQDTVYTTEIDTEYLKGIECLEKRNYKEALRILSPYKDINSAITLMSLGYDKHALEIMETTPQNANRDYMLAVLCARTGNAKKGFEYFEAACKAEPSFEYRANLDPEMQIILKALKKSDE